MDALRNADWRAAFELLGRLCEAGEGLEAFARAAVDALPRLVASELTTLSVCDLHSGRRAVVGVPGGAIGADRHVHAPTRVAYHADRRRRGAHRIGDSIVSGRLREPVLSGDPDRHDGIDHVLALPLQVDADRRVSIVLNRRGRDFSERELVLLDRLTRPLAALFRRAQAFDRLRAAAEPAAAETGGAARFTPREQQVLHWLAAAKTDREIAALLGCSHRTVHKHLQHIYVKLGVETRTAAVMRALRPGLPRGAAQAVR